MSDADFWVPTYSGRRFSLTRPDPDEIDIVDVAHHLANICRFTGATRSHYSVAQHSVLVSLHVRERGQLNALLHDAAEAYVGDVSRPVKYREGMMDYRILEQRVDAAVRKKFRLEYDIYIEDEIKKADDRAMATEVRDLLVPHPDWKRWLKFEPFPEKIVPLSPEAAEAAFLSRYKELT